MSDIKITAEAITKLKWGADKSSQNVYNHCREQFVAFLNENNLDWKIGKTQRQTDLFQQSLGLYWHAGAVTNDKDPQALLNEIGGQIYKNRQSIKEDKEAGPMIRKVADKIIKEQASYFTEAYELEQAIKTMDKNHRDLLIQVFVKKSPVSQLDGKKDKVEASLQLLVETMSGKPASSKIQLAEEDNSFTIVATDNTEKDLVNWINNGFSGMGKQDFSRLLKQYEEIRKDELRLKKLKSSQRDSQGREMYLNYRKINAINLTENHDLEMEQILGIAPTIWQIFLKNVDDNKIVSPLEIPLKDYLEAISLKCLGKSPDADIASQLDFSPSIAQEELEKWEQAIKKEEEILDGIKDNDQLYFSKLVKQYENDFTIALRKVFKLYDPATRDRPGEIYYRSFSEVIYKVQNGDLTKPLTSTFKTYLTGVGMNHYRQEYYKKGEKPLDIDEGIVENIAEPETIEDRFKSQENAHKVQKYLQLIGEPCKTLLEMKFLKGYNYEVIALRMEKKEGALRTRVSRCLDRLRTMLFE